jgi:hypothetical protein
MLPHTIYTPLTIKSWAWSVRRVCRRKRLPHILSHFASRTFLLFHFWAKSFVMTQFYLSYAHFGTAKIFFPCSRILHCTRAHLDTKLAATEAHSSPEAIDNALKLHVRSFVNRACSFLTRPRQHSIRSPSRSYKLRSRRERLGSVSPSLLLIAQALSKIQSASLYFSRNILETRWHRRLLGKQRRFKR